MAGRSKYTEEDKARVFVLLQANDGNVKRTARESGLPENTVRRWRNEFNDEGPPSTEMVEQAASDFVATAERIRNKALDWAEEMIDQRDAKVKMNDLNNLAGTLQDKIDRAKGLDAKRVDVQHHLPSADEARELLRGFVQEMAVASAGRDAEILEAEIVEQAALPSGS
jgi:transposase-like protein